MRARLGDRRPVLDMQGNTCLLFRQV